MKSPEQVELHSKVRAAFEKSHDSAGAGTIAVIVKIRGTNLRRDRAGRLLRKLGLVSCQLRSHKYKKASQEHIAVSNTQDRQFDVQEPNKVWCVDVTYICSGRRWA